VNKLVHLRQPVRVLFNGYPADESKNANRIVKVRRHRSDRIFGLRGELTGGLHDEALRSIQTLHDMVQASYSEANRFARPTLTDAE
jgi:hypothetical protein